MGEASLYVRDRQARRTTGLDQSRKLGIQIRQSGLQHFPMTGILGGIQLSQHVFARQREPLSLAITVEFSGGKRRIQMGRGRGGLGLLLFNRLAFPASCHRKLYPLRQR